VSRPLKEPSRYYIVSDKRDGAQCLVEANTKRQALTYTAQRYCDVRMATTREAINMMADGKHDVIRWDQQPEQMDIEDVLKPGPVQMTTRTDAEMDQPPRGHEPEVLPPVEPAAPPPRKRVQPGRMASEVFGKLGERNDE
jgi:hypothetical protein